jgi:hypothetical protein
VLKKKKGKRGGTAARKREKVQLGFDEASGKGFKRREE